MTKKPTTAAGYAPHMVERVRQTCLYLATKLGELMEEIVVVGGLVPSLLINQSDLPADVEPHAGTMDLDLGLAFALVNADRYQEISERLRRAGFEPDRSETGRIIRQRWCMRDPWVTVDFLVEPVAAKASDGGRLFDLEKDWAAIIAPGLHLAFSNFHRMPLSGPTILGEHATRTIRVCGAGAYIILKALAFRNRGEPKDAYDLFYLLRNYGDGIDAVVTEFLPLRTEPLAQKTLEILKEDFTNPSSVGPRRISRFLHGVHDPELEADAAGYVRDFLRRLYQPLSD